MDKGASHLSSVDRELIFRKITGLTRRRSSFFRGGDTSNRCFIRLSLVGRPGLSHIVTGLFRGDPGPGTEFVLGIGGERAESYQKKFTERSQRKFRVEVRAFKKARNANLLDTRA